MCDWKQLEPDRHHRPRGAPTSIDVGAWECGANVDAPPRSSTGPHNVLIVSLNSGLFRNADASASTTGPLAPRSMSTMATPAAEAGSRCCASRRPMTPPWPFLDAALLRSSAISGNANRRIVSAARANAPATSASPSCCAARARSIKKRIWSEVAAQLAVGMRVFTLPNGFDVDFGVRELFDRLSQNRQGEADSFLVSTVFVTFVRRHMAR